MPDPLETLGQMMGFGKIASVDLQRGRITVSQGDLETGAIRWVMGGAGKTRIWLRPAVGEQVLLFAPEGDMAGAIALRGVDCAQFPPLCDPNRDVIQFEDGAVIAYDPAVHRLAFALPDNATVTIDAPGGVSIKGPVSIDGAVDIGGKLTATDDVVGAGKSLKSHLHTRVQAGTAISGPPQ